MLAAVAAAPGTKREALDAPKPIAILRSTSEVTDDGAYNFR